MKNVNWLRVVVLTWFIAGPIALTLLQADRRPVPSTLFQLTPQALPTSLSNISTLGNGQPPVGVDVYLCRLDFAIAPNSGTVNITVQSAGSTVTKFWDAVPITATATTGASYNNVIASSAPEACVYFPKGVAVLASGSGVMITALSGRY